jgi:hypothetical protein
MEKLNSVEVTERRIPIDRDGFSATWISTNKILFDDFTIKTVSQRLFKGICGMNLIRRKSFKNPITIWAFEGKFRFRHNILSIYYFIHVFRLL